MDVGYAAKTGVEHKEEVVKERKNKGVTDLGWLKDDAYIDEAGLADALDKSGRTVRRMVVRGELPAPFLFGGRRQWRVGDVKDWIDGLAEQAKKDREREDAEISKISNKNKYL